MSLVARNRKRKRHDIRRVLYACGAGLVCAGTLVGAHSYTLVRDSLRVEECEAIKLGQNTKVYDANQRILSTIASESNRQEIRFDQMPKSLLDATVAIEDKKFGDHAGIDYERIVGAAVKDVGGGSGRQGGSTITMQLMKNLCHPTQPRTVSNKLQEAYWADEYEKTHTKEQILQRYLNSVFLGNTAVGVQAASLIYFDRPASQLTLPQAALLAGLPQAPSDYNPRAHPEAAIERRNLVLSEMAKDGFITEEKAAQAKQAGLGLKKGDAFTLKREAYFVDYVEAQLTTELGKVKDKKTGKTKVDIAQGRKKVRNGGYKVYTTINPRLQNVARNVMRNAIRSRFGTGDTPAAAIVMLEAKTGRIVVMASTANYGTNAKFNLAGPSAKRQAGSTYKTFVLTAMMKAGVSPSTRYFSVSPIKIAGFNCADEGVGGGTFKTYGGKGGGSQSIHQATLASDNSTYVQMTCDIGPQAVYDTAKSMGIRSMVNDIDNHNLALGLGGLNRGVNVLEMARAYAPLANGGYRVNLMPMSKLVRPDGKVNVFQPVKTRIFSDGVAAEVTKILRANVTGGTGTRANLFNVPVAGKTGTVDQAVDAWFVGYTPKYVTAVWLGYPNARRPMPGMTGGALPAAMWHAFMVEATKGQSGQSFPAPKTPFVAKPFSGYYSGQAARLAAAAAAKAAAEKAKQAPKPDDEKTPTTPTTPTTPATPPAAPPATPPATPPTTP